MIRGSGDEFRDKTAERILYESLKLEIKEFAKGLIEKYKEKLNKINEIKDSQVGYRIFDIERLTWEYIKQDEDLRKVVARAGNYPLVTRKMVKQIFKDCFNEVLDTETNLIENGKPKTKRMLLVELIVEGVLTGNITANQLRGLEIIRDTVGEKPTTEIINKGIQAKLIDINITKEKVDRVKGILDGLRSANITDGYRKDFALGRSSERPGNEGAVEVDVSGESERVHNPDILPDKQD